jgi:hypothetical protein
MLDFLNALRFGLRSTHRVFLNGTSGLGARGEQSRQGEGGTVGAFEYCDLFDRGSWVRILVTWSWCLPRFSTC